MQDDADLDPIRGLAEFGEIMKGGHLDRAYAAVWTGDAGFPRPFPCWVSIRAIISQRCRELEFEGYRHGLASGCPNLA